MAKVSLQRISTFQNDVSAPAAFNANMALLEQIIDTLLSRDGKAPNTVEADIDMNGQRLYNLPVPESLTEPVTQAQLNDLVLSNTAGAITDGSVGTSAIATEAVTTGKIATEAVTTDKLANGSVTSVKIASGTINDTNVAPGSIGLDKLASIGSFAVVGNNTAAPSAPPDSIPFADLAVAMAAYGASGIPVGVVLPYTVAAPPAGYLTCDGSAVSRTTFSALFNVLCPVGEVTFDTVSNTITWVGNKLRHGDKIYFYSTGTLPGGMSPSTAYYAANVSGNTFQFALTPGGAALDLTGSPTGTHYCVMSNYGLGNGTTTFNLPDFRGEFLRGLDLGRGIDPNRSLSAVQGQQLENHIHSVANVWTQAASATPYPSSGNLAPGTGYTSTPISGSYGTETRPRNQAIHYIIKY